MKINWMVRFKNPLWWFQIALAVITPVLAYFGLTGSDITTWATLWDTLVRAISNPYVVFLVLVAAWNAVQDPTTSGINDSNRALAYTVPKKEELK